MKLAIMQPYFVPYIGYFQLIAAVDQFIVYDNIKYTKSGWINRNRILQNGKDVMLSLPLKHDADTLDVRERRLAQQFRRDKMLNQLREAYRGAPFFDTTYALCERIVGYADDNLFGFLHHSLLQVCRQLGLTTPIRIASEIDADHSLKSEQRVLALCAAVGADSYLNTSGGRELYSEATFRQRGIALQFIRAKPCLYRQFGAPCVPALSIIDVLMFNEPETIAEWLATGYELL